MKKLGYFVVWSIRDMEVTKEKMEALGYGDFLPRNDYKAAMIRGLNKILESDAFYKRFDDGGFSTVKFTVFSTRVVSGVMKAMSDLTIELDKRSGFCTFKNEDGSKAEGTNVEAVKAAYESCKVSLDSRQFGAMVLKVLQDEGHAKSIRAGGGAYFLSHRFEEVKTKVKALFDAFPTTTRIHFPSQFDESETVSLIEESIASDLIEQIKGLTADIDKGFQSGDITPRTLKSKKEQAETILAEINVHREHIASAAEKVTRDIENVSKALMVVTAKVEADMIDPDDFQKALAAL